MDLNWENQQRYVLVMFGSVLELPEEYMRVAEVAIGASLGRFVAELARDLQPLSVKADCACEVAQ